MQKLFEYKIFRTDEPYELIFTDEFNKAVNDTIFHEEIFGYGSRYRSIEKSVLIHFLTLYKGDIQGQKDAIDKTISILFNLENIGLLKDARKNVTKQDMKELHKAVDQECEKIYGKLETA